MIPKTALAALSLLMAVSAAFGFCIRGIVDKARQERRDAKKRRRDDDYSADVDRWEDDDKWFMSGSKN